MAVLLLCHHQLAWLFQWITLFQSVLMYAVSNIKHPGLSLKPEQVAAIQAVNWGKNVFVWLPTGFGKSLCYKALPFVYDCSELCIIDADSHKSLVLVISPLVCYPNGRARHRLLLLREEVRLFYSSNSLTQISCRLLKHCCWTSSRAGKDGTKTMKTSHSCF